MLPLLKLGTLALKTLSKPIAARLKHQAAIHPRFRNIIVGVAQVFCVLLGFCDFVEMDRLCFSDDDDKYCGVFL